jgi:hypothetical protein
MPNIWTILSDLWADSTDFKAGVAAIEGMVTELKASKMPTAAQIAAVEKIAADLIKLAGAL